MTFNSELHKTTLTGGTRLQVCEVILQPSDIDNIEMVSRFIEKENISPEQHRSSQREFHFPPAR